MIIIFSNKGCFPSKNMQSPPLRSGNLDIKDVQCTKTKDVLKKIISHHIALWAIVNDPKRVVMGGSQICREDWN